MTAVLELPGATTDQDDGRPVRAPARRDRLAAGALAAASLSAVLVAALVVGGGAPAAATPGLPDAGAVVGWGQPVVRLLGRLLAVLVVGSLLVPAALVPTAGGLSGPSRGALRTAAAAAAGWVACEAAALLLLTGSLLGVPVTRLAPADVGAVVAAFPAGRTAVAVLVLLTAVAAGSAAARTGTHARVVLLLALATAVLPVVTTGHPAAAGDHVATVVVLAVHVVAASLWVGGLVGVLVHLRRAPSLLVAAVRRLSRLALVCVSAVTVTGLAGASLVTDVGTQALLDSGYGHLLLVKTGATALLVAVGWAHRRHLLPRLGSGRPGAFLRLAVVETALMAAVLAVAVGLSAAPPPDEPSTTASSAAPAQPRGRPAGRSLRGSVARGEPRRDAPGPRRRRRGRHGRTRPRRAVRRRAGRRQPVPRR